MNQHKKDPEISGKAKQIQVKLQHYFGCQKAFGDIGLFKWLALIKPLLSPPP